LLLHECFHRLQKKLGLPARDAVNNHLDTLNGRIWIQMEWRALERALRQTGPARQAAIADALLFRSYRRSLFPGSANHENALELNEGLRQICRRQCCGQVSSFARRATIPRLPARLRTFQAQRTVLSSISVASRGV
jgi:hypothetical protein